MKFGGNSTHQRAGLPTQLLPHAFRVATAMVLCFKRWCPARQSAMSADIWPDFLLSPTFQGAS